MKIEFCMLTQTFTTRSKYENPTQKFDLTYTTRVSNVLIINKKNNCISIYKFVYGVMVPQYKNAYSTQIIIINTMEYL